MALTQDELLVYLQKNLRLDTSRIQADTALFSSGIIDSFSMLELIQFIETNCAIRVKASDMNLDNLDSIKRILAFVDKRRGAHG